jgi:RNA polymerase sigma-70 factor, ECF subfamily
MRSSLGNAGHTRLDEIANSAADEAMMTLLAQLHTFEGRSRFTTWAYKFAILQSATEVRRLAWRHREISLDELADVPARDPGPTGYTEGVDLVWAVRRAIDTALTPHQRRVTVALLVDEVPIDVLAERLGTNRNALYKTVHDARARLRADLVASGHLPAQPPKEGTP